MGRFNREADAYMSLDRDTVIFDAEAAKAELKGIDLAGFDKAVADKTLHFVDPQAREFFSEAAQAQRRFISQLQEGQHRQRLTDSDAMILLQRRYALTMAIMGTSLPELDTCLRRRAEDQRVGIHEDSRLSALVHVIKALDNKGPHVLTTADLH